MKIFISAGLIALAVIAGCSSNKEYDIKITEAHGVKTVSNPNYPKDGVFDLVPEEFYTLGKEEDNSKYMMSQPSFIELDSKDNLYVYDRSGPLFFVFDKEGNFKRSFGKKGAGPGDLCGLAFFKISSDDKLIINDVMNKRFCLWSDKGEYLEGFKYLKSHSFIELDSKNNIYATERGQDLSKLTDREQRINVTNNLVRYNQGEISPALIKKFEGQYSLLQNVSGGVMGEERNSFIFKISPSDKLCTGFVDKYEFSVFSPDGKPILNFNREFSPVPNRDYKEGKQNPEYLSAFSIYSLFDDKSNFWVCLDYPQNPETYTFDIFSEEGVFTKQIVTPFKPLIIRRNKIYSIVYSKTGPVYIKAFKYSLKKREKQL